jgi:hypothetical protein
MIIRAPGRFILSSCSCIVQALASFCLGLLKFSKAHIAINITRQSSTSVKLFVFTSTSWIFPCTRARFLFYQSKPHQAASCRTEIRAWNLMHAWVLKTITERWRYIIGHRIQFSHRTFTSSYKKAFNLFCQTKCQKCRYTCIYTLMWLYKL